MGQCAPLRNREVPEEYGICAIFSIAAAECSSGKGHERLERSSRPRQRQHHRSTNTRSQPAPATAAAHNRTASSAAEQREQGGDATTPAGTSTVGTPDGTPSLVRLSGIVEAVAALMRRGTRVILVSSGAVGCGRGRLRRQAALHRSLRDTLAHDGKEKGYSSASAAAGQLVRIRVKEGFSRHRRRAGAHELVRDAVRHARDRAEPARG